MILGRHQYSSSELDECWLRGEEYADIARACCKEIEKLGNGVTLKNRKYCSRGLESHTKLAFLSKAQNRRAVLDAVLGEQYKQISMGLANDEVISQRYQDASFSTRLWAQAVALQDQKAVVLVYDDLLDEVELVNSSF